jgi:hypothetical protein
MKEKFKVGDRVKTKVNPEGYEGTITKKTDGKFNLFVEFKNYSEWYSKDEVEKIEDKPQVFELKEGMKFKAKHCLNNLTVEKVEKLEKSNRYLHGGVWSYESQIDWEATRKLNEYPEENKEFPNKKESEPKQEKYIIWNPEGCNPKKIHSSLESAEERAERFAFDNPNQEFYILKAVKKFKGTVKVESEEL